MSFCGFVTFSTAPGAEAAGRALRHWLAASAACADVREWTSASSRGWLSAFSLVPNPAHAATLAADDDTWMVGDVPRGWHAGPGGAVRRARLAAAGVGDDIDGAIPDIEFAMGFWAPASSRLTLYRCPFGARALLYVAVPRQWIAFASLPEPLLALPGVKDVIDEAALPSQLLLAYADRTTHDRTMFARLRRLPPAHRLRFTEDAMAIEAYWGLPERPHHNFGHDDPEVPRALRGLLDRAVHRRMQDRDRVGTQLSGGIDSSAVTALASAQRGGGTSLFVYTIRSYDQHGDLVSPLEQELAHALLDTLDGAVARDVPHGKANRPYYLNQREYLDRPLPDMVFKLGADHRLYDAARRDGCATVLTGWGGDEMASARGSLHVLAMLAERRWGLAWRNLALGGGETSWLGAFQNTIVSPLWNSVRQAGQWTPDELAVVQAAFAGKPLADAALNPLRRRDWSLRRRRRNRLSSLVFAGLLELHDWLGQRAGLAVGHPLLDRDLIAFCDAIPPEWVGHLGTTRRAFRSAVSDVLPPGQITRVKAPLPRSSDDGGWFLRYWAQQQRAVRDLAASDTWLHQYLNLDVLARGGTRLGAGRRELRWPPIAQLGAGSLVVARIGGLVPSSTIARE